MRMMVVFEKGETLRYIGHLDLMRAMQRALRRSGLPIRYSNGFNPHIRLSFAAPLSVGVVGPARADGGAFGGRRERAGLSGRHERRFARLPAHPPVPARWRTASRR